MSIKHFSLDELSHGLASLHPSPTESGTVDLLVTRTGDGVRSTPQIVELSPTGGVEGDHWALSPYAEKPEMQVSMINTRVLDLVAGGSERWHLAGDNLVVDFDIGVANLPPGVRVQVGTAIIEISAKAHRGCAKFSARYGMDAREFVNLGDGPARRLRGVYASVVKSGSIRVGDTITKLARPVR